MSEDPKLGKDPLHRAGLSMDALEGRVDYMGSSILMARLSDMTLTLRDEWKIDKVQDFDAPLATTRLVLLIIGENNIEWILSCLNPIALRKAKTAHNFGLSEWNRVKLHA